MKNHRNHPSILKFGPRGLPVCSELLPLPVSLLTRNQPSQPSRKESLKPQSAGAKHKSLDPAPQLVVSSNAASSQVSLNASGLLSRAWSWIRVRQAARFRPRRLQVAETVSLGEKRFVAVIKIDGLQYLIGGGATNVTLLTQLNEKESFGELLKETTAASDELNAEPIVTRSRNQK